MCVRVRVRQVIVFGRMVVARCGAGGLLSITGAAPDVTAGEDALGVNIKRLLRFTTCQGRSSILADF